jgi:geranylgeranyl reductase family protein
MLTTDVAVVGGGPAGAAAAIALARAGRDVVLVDKATFPRDKCCGDGLTTGALRRLDAIGLDPRAIRGWQTVDGCWVRSPSGRTAEFPFPTGDGMFGAVAPRLELDAAILDLARAAGATVLEGHALTGATWSRDAITLAVGTGDRVSARYAIGADGMWSPLRKAVGAGDVAAAPPGYLGEWHAFRQYFVDTGPLARRMWVWFEEDLLPGYAWSFPLPAGRANVGFGVHRASGAPTRALADTWRRLLDRPHIRDVLGPDARPQAAHRTWPIPARLPDTAVSGAGGRALFVGDAARASDPMTGEGIAQALESASLAVEAVLAAGPERPLDTAMRYRRTLSRGMARDHHVADLLARALASPRGARGAVRIAAATAWTRGNFARWLFEDYPRAAIVTPARWRPNMLSGSGAFRSPARSGA